MNVTKLGSYIKAKREEMRLNQEELAQRLNVTQGYITKIENGKKTPSYDVLNSIAKLFNITPGFLTDILLDEEKIAEPEEENQKLLYWLSADKNISTNTKRILENIIRQEYEQTKKTTRTS